MTLLKFNSRLTQAPSYGFAKLSYGNLSYENLSYENLSYENIP